MHGVSVGEVRSVALDTPAVEVRFTLDSGIRLGEETTAQVKVATLLGNHYLEVDPSGRGLPRRRHHPPGADVGPLQPPGRPRAGHLGARRAHAVLLARALTATSDALGSPRRRSGRRSRGSRRSRGDQRPQHPDRATAARGPRRERPAERRQPVTVRADEVGQPRDRGGRAPARGDPPAASRPAAWPTTRSTRSCGRPATTSTRRCGDLNTALASLRQQDQQLQDVLVEMAPAVRYVANATCNGPYLDLVPPPTLGL